MEPIVWRTDQALLTAEFLGLTPVLLHVVTRERSAWYGRWSRIYKGAHGLTHTLDAARILAERNRSQGSSFVIREVPGIALLSSEGPVAIVEFHSEKCFGRWDHAKGAGVLAIGTPMSQLLRTFGSDGTWSQPKPSEHSIIMGKGERGTFEPPPPKRPLRLWVSDSRGGRYLLSWRQVPPRQPYTRAGVFDIVRTFSSANSDAEVATGRERYWNPG
jgi:hypothetical protein